jgi:hypothetical protein
LRKEIKNSAENEKASEDEADIDPEVAAKTLRHAFSIPELRLRAARKTAGIF